MSVAQEVSHLQRRIFLSLVVAGTVALIEVIGGILSNSLALLSDAGHVGTDALSLALAFTAMIIARLPHTPTLSYGYHRAEVLAAVTNAASLLLVSAYVFHEAYLRFLQPPEVNGAALISVAGIGLAGNLVMLFLLKGGTKISINVKSAFLHVLYDTISSIGVIAGGVVIIATKFYLADSLVGILIGALMLKSSIGLIRETVEILLERTPRGIQVEKVVQEVIKVEGVRSVHDLHIWSLTSGMYVMSAHIDVDEHRRDHEVVESLNRLLRDKFNIYHTTIQVEHYHKNDLVEIDTDKV